MSSNRKKRMSMLDNLAASGTPPATSTMMPGNRALRAARDAVDSHHVWELDPDLISDRRMADRLTPEDVADLRDAIETNGQAVPILVRRDPGHADRYLLVYGRRRLEAIRSSDKVTRVRALVANLDDDDAMRAQISENMARRDLSFIEKALFDKELVETGFGNQSQVAEVLTVSKSAISMAIAIVETVGPDLVRAIGPAHGIGRPRWDALGQAIDAARADPDRLIRIAEDVHDKATVAMIEGSDFDPADVSVKAFEAVEKAVSQPAATRGGSGGATAPRTRRRALTVGGAVKRTARGVTIELDEGDFADWVETRAETLIEELHDRWQKRREE